MTNGSTENILFWQIDFINTVYRIFCSLTFHREFNFYCLLFQEWIVYQNFPESPSINHMLGQNYLVYYKEEFFLLSVRVDK